LSCVGGDVRRRIMSVLLPPPSLVGMMIARVVPSCMPVSVV
jgi:hypothetical protein